ncbi:MAG: M20/M25/M40 family metallo-hydrolase [Chitinophagaceae bacterium]|nr:M20/M25/M40 family metallo-hydrolase [Chitinophagaceae bacterium]
MKEILSIPNDASVGKDIRNNIVWLNSAFKEAGFETVLLDSPAEPFVLATSGNNPELPTVLFYMHFDGQPVYNADWQQTGPYAPVLKKKINNNWEQMEWESVRKRYDPEWRVFARSASDDKGPIAMFLAAMAILKSENRQPAYNIKVILDSEEEKGSPNLPDLVSRYQYLLKADRLVILDGPRHTSNAPTLIFGCRGVAQVDLTVFGPRGDLHSGHFGNYAPNPAYELALLLAAMKDENGKVIVPGFYQGVQLDNTTLELMKAVPDRKDIINQQIGIARETDTAMSYQEGLQYPSLNILNMTSGQPEAGTRNIVPSRAAASLDIRLVPGSDPIHLENALKKFITSKGYYFIDGASPTETERREHPRMIHFQFTLQPLAFVTEPDSPSGQWLSAVIESVHQKKPVMIRMAGGTVPIAPFIQALKIPAVIIPTVNPDNNQHAANENVRLGNYFEGISLVRSLLLSRPF